MQRFLADFVVCGFSLLLAAMVIFLANIGASTVAKSENTVQGYFPTAQRLWARIIQPPLPVNTVRQLKVVVGSFSSKCDREK
jgi:hypothetical protein